MQERQKKAAAARAAARRAERRRRLLLAGASVVAVAAVVGTILGIQASTSTAKAAGSATDSSVVRSIASVPQSVYDTVGTGSATGPKAVSGAPLTMDGKPEVLYIGGEYCPFCAAERWALAATLSRFGTLTVSRLIHSTPADVYPNTPTLSYANASYTSSSVAFAPVEWFGEASDPSTPFGHVYLQQPTAPEQAVFDQYSGGAIPFVDIAGKYVVPAAQYLPSDLAGLTWQQIAADMKDPSSKVAQDIDGAANYLTAALIKAGAKAPAGLASSPGVQAAMAKLGS